MSTQTDERNECDAMGTPLQDEIEKEEAQKQYKLLTIERSRINEDIYQRKLDEHQINKKLMWFTQHDQYIHWKKQEIKNLERYLRENEPELRTNSVPRTPGFLRLHEKDTLTPDRKRCQKRLIKKGRMDIDYLEQVKEDLLFSKKSGNKMTPAGTQEANYLMDSMAQRIQHGSKHRVDEMRIFFEMKNVKETREMYTAPPEPDQREGRSKYDVDLKRALQHKIKILLEEIEDLKMDLKGRNVRIARIKSELEIVRKSITCLHKELEDVNKKRIEAYERANCWKLTKI